MPLTDLYGPCSFPPRWLRRCRISPSFVFSAAAILSLSCATIGASLARAQDQNVAEAARQERARKHQQRKPSKHVYTEEDLKRQHILTPEDQALVEARKNECAQKNNCSPAPQQNPPGALDANSQPQQPSLGEVARQLRTQKDLQAVKPQQSAPFHLEVPAPALAAPVVPARPAIRPPAPPVLRPESRTPATGGNVFRRDPFARVPTRPRGPLGDTRQLHPALHPPARLVTPVAPKLSAHPAPPAKPLLQPSQPVPAPEAPQAAAPGLRIEPVRPSIPLKDRRATLPAAPANIFPPAKPDAPLALPSTRPSAPNATIRPVEPRRPVASLSSSLTAPSDSSATTILVQQGDSLWRLAQRHFGHGYLWPQILAANPSIADPNQLRIGASLNLPVMLATRPAASNTPSSLRRTIKVHKGDSLWTLAKANLGHSANWPCLANANPSLSNPDLIFAGQELSVPAACKAPSASVSHPAKE